MTPSRLGTGILTGSPQVDRIPPSRALVMRALSLLRCLVGWPSLPPKPEIGQDSHGPRGHPRTYPKSTFRLMFKFDSVAYTPKTLGEKNARQSPWMTPQRGAPTLALLCSPSLGRLILGNPKLWRASHGFSVTRLGRLSPPLPQIRKLSP